MPPHPYLVAVKYAVLALLLIHVANQVRKPTKRTGRLFLWLMNATHSTLTDWGLSHLTIDPHAAILDVGCGGGRTIQKLTTTTDGPVYGIDYADGSVAASRAKNAALIQAGRVAIEQASVSQLPFPDNKFDVVTAVETQYYWPDPASDMHEIRRGLRPGGALIVIAETYRNGRFSRLQRPIMKLLKSTNLTVEEHRDLFSQAGYTDIETFEHRAKGWFCGIGRKPA